MKYEKLPLAFKTRWVKALRSKKFIQGENDLKSWPDTIWVGYAGQIKHCCLGVACEIVGAKIRFEKSPSFIQNDGSRTIKGITKIPKSLRGESITATKLAKMNDSGKWSFKRIASWIERTL